MRPTARTAPPTPLASRFHARRTAGPNPEPPRFRAGAFFREEPDREDPAPRRGVLAVDPVDVRPAAPPVVRFPVDFAD
ncbi:hypothetical protein [Streptoalloteichus hindustanus]|uniref:hypothetical protein n=1 Tax=Streptoalloteichus hindustanus TaxID=2017 RepID=UPI00389AFEE4